MERNHSPGRVESVVRIGTHIGDVNSTTFEQGASGGTPALWRDRHVSPAFHDFGGEAVGFGAVEHAIDLPGNRALVGVAQTCRRFDQRLQHRLEVEGRSADDLEHVGGGGLLLQRFAQILVRACTSSNSRAFSMAITAWSAKVVTSSICLSVNGRTVLPPQQR